MENKVQSVNILHYEENIDELKKLKGKWEIENKFSGTLEVPENILDLEGVEYLLQLNTFNEVPTVLRIVAPILVDYKLLSEASGYSEAKYEEYVEKGTEIIERLLSLYDSLGIDLAEADEIDSEHNTDLLKSSKWYIETLASKIGKSEVYNFN